MPCSGESHNTVYSRQLAFTTVPGERRTFCKFSRPNWSLEILNAEQTIKRWSCILYRFRTSWTNTYLWQCQSPCNGPPHVVHWNVSIGCLWNAVTRRVQRSQQTNIEGMWWWGGVGVAMKEVDITYLKLWAHPWFWCWCGGTRAVMAYICGSDVPFATTRLTAVPSYQPLIYLGIWLIGEGVHMISQLPLTKGR